MTEKEKSEESFERFRSLAKRLVSVPKKELDRRVAQYDRKKQEKRGA